MIMTADEKRSTDVAEETEKKEQEKKMLKKERKRTGMISTLRTGQDLETVQAFAGQVRDTERHSYAVPVLEINISRLSSGRLTVLETGSDQQTMNVTASLFFCSIKEASYCVAKDCA